MSRSSVSFLRHLRSILILPFTVTVLIPLAIHSSTSTYTLQLSKNFDSVFLPILGIFFLIIGLLLFSSTLWLFHQRGKGTLAPWDPPKQLVIQGPYCYVRNPMISGVNAILLAEAFLLISPYLLAWQISFFVLNHIYFVYKEEPELLQRFGTSYQKYMQHVPRWMPRWQPWSP